MADIAVRHPETVEVARHYGLTIRNCLPAHPEAKGGSQATVGIAKADVMPTNCKRHRASTLGGIWEKIFFRALPRPRRDPLIPKH